MTTWEVLLSTERVNLHYKAKFSNATQPLFNDDIRIIIHDNNIILHGYSFLGFCHCTCFPPHAFSTLETEASVTARDNTQKTLYNLHPIVALASGLTSAPQFSPLQLLCFFFHLEVLRGGAGHPRKKLFHTAVCFLLFFSSFDPLDYSSVRIVGASTRRPRLGPLRATGESYTRRNRESETNIRKGTTLLNKTKHRATAKFV